MPLALDIQEISKRYAKRGTVALNGVSFGIEDGEIMVLVGESGSGKSTLLRIIAGLIHPDNGTVEIAGQEVFNGKTSLVPPEKRNVGLVFQDYALFPHMTVRKNILYGLHRMPRPKREQRVQEVIKLAHLSDLEERYPHELSGGQQQRVALARALAPKPPIILLDEPFSNLDPVRRDQLRGEVQQIVKESGTTALIVTHDTRDALAVADRLLVLQNGSLQQVGTPEEVYFHSSNEYTASLFGKVNRIPCQLFNSWQGEPSKSVVWLRPGHLELGDHLTDTEFLVGKVIHSAFCGSHREVTLECGESEPKTQVTLYVDPDRVVKVGATVTVRRRADPQGERTS